MHYALANCGMRGRYRFVNNTSIIASAYKELKVIYNPYGGIYLFEGSIYVDQIQSSPAYQMFYWMENVFTFGATKSSHVT